jgi:hypothetical protein
MTLALFMKKIVYLQHETKNNFDNSMHVAMLDGEYGWRLAIC